MRILPKFLAAFVASAFALTAFGAAPAQAAKDPAKASKSFLDQLNFHAAGPITTAASVTLGQTTTSAPASDRCPTTDSTLERHRFGHSFSGFSIITLHPVHQHLKCTA